MSQEAEPSQRVFDLPPIAIAQEAIPELTLLPSERVKPPVDIDFDKDWLSRYELREEEFAELLEKARTAVFSMGMGDAASQIGEVVSQFFVAKMYYVQEKLGLPRYASVIQPPDATIQTYHQKFLRSVPETAKIKWGRETSKAEFIPAEVDIDFCGMVAVGMNERLSGLELAENITLMKERLKILEKWPLDTNCIQPGNHFANVYRVLESERFGLPSFLGIAHLASDEYRNLMRDFVEKLALKIETPFGVCLALVGEPAQKYWEIAQEGSYFAQKKRLLIAQEVFRSDHILANDTHYQMIGPSSCVIGCNEVGSESDYHVIVAKATKEGYLVQGKKGLSSQVIQEKGVRFSNPLYQDLLEADILPHGSGHSLVEDKSLKLVRFSQEGIFYVTELQSGGERVVKHYHAVPTIPRRSILANVLEYRLVNENFATLEPLCSVKI